MDQARKGAMEIKEMLDSQQLMANADKSKLFLLFLESYPDQCPLLKRQQQNTQTNKYQAYIPMTLVSSGGDHYAQNHP